MIDFGTVLPGSTLDVLFDTYAGSTGASITLTGLAVTDIEIYKSGGVTQRASDTGYTLLDTDGIDFDAITGIHGFSIDLSSNATADFFTAGASYYVVVSAVTIDSQTVNFVAARFRIGYVGALLDTTIATLATQTSFTLTVGPAENDALLGCIAVIHDIASAVQWGKALITAYTGATKTVTLAAGVTFTAAAGDNISILQPSLQPTTWGRTLDVSSGGEAGLDWANIGSPTTAQNLSATNIDVDQIVASVSGAVGSVTGLTAANLDATISSRASQTSVNTIDDFLDTEIASIQADTDNIQTRLPASLINGRMDSHVMAIASDLLNEITGAWGGTADSGTTTTVVDSERTEPDTDYWKGSLINFVDGTLLGQTRLVTAFNPATDTITFAPATTVAVAALHTYRLLPAGRADMHFWLGSLVNALVSGRVDSSTGAMAADVVTAAAIATNAIDADALAADAVTEIQSGLATSAALATVQADTDNIQTRLPIALNGGYMDSHVTSMDESILISVTGSWGGTADSGTTTTVVDTERTEPDVDYWKGALINFTDLTLLGQTRLVTGFNPTTDTITFAPPLTVAVTTHAYRLWPAGRADVGYWLGSLVNALTSGRVDASVGAMASSVMTRTAIGTDYVAGIRSISFGNAESGTTTTMVEEGGGGGGDNEQYTGQLLVFTSGFIAGEARVITAYNAATGTYTFAPALTRAVTTQSWEIWPITDAMRPTVSGRTLDVTAAGEAGIDWANIGTPTSAQTLSGTTVGTATALGTSERNSIADALLDRADAIETGLTLRQAERLVLAALAGKLSGADTTTIVIRNAVADSKNRITATVTSGGNRTAVSYDVS